MQSKVCPSEAKIRENLPSPGGRIDILYLLSYRFVSSSLGEAT